MRRRTFLMAAALGAAGCLQGSDSSIASAKVWGGEGLRDGNFIRPRAIGVHDREVFVIDTTGRVQVFDESGKFVRLWNLPTAENGTPTAITFFEGRVIIPDTHQSRILEYSPQGELLEKWGHYGNGPGTFIYPTGLARDRSGTYFISEYGQGAERVHVFDRNRTYRMQWGAHGPEPGQFNRAMSICLAPDETLIVADTTNHRLQRFTGTGKLIDVIGGAHKGNNPLKYPHSVCTVPQGVLVAEYGNHQISHFTLEGRLVRAYGTPGRAPGAFNAPRGVAASPDGTVFVADTDNHRIQSFKLRDA